MANVSSQLHDIGCWKPAFSCPSQEWGLYSFAVCTRLWQYSEKSLKRTTALSAYYYTSRGSWYSVPERSLGLFEITSMSQTSVVKASKDEISMMREWARAHGSSVRQRSYHGKGCNSARLFVPKGDRSWRKNRPFFKQCGNHRHQLRIQHHWCRRRKRRTRTRTHTSITRDLPIKISTSSICLTLE